MANIKDGATGTVLTAPSPQSSGTTLVLNSGEGARFPAPPFWAIAGPNNGLPLVSVAEKILVTGVSTDTFTIVRAPFGPYTAKNIDVGWRISNAIFQDDFNNASIITNEVPAGAVNGVNNTYTLASSVHTTGSLEVFADGMHLKGGGNDYTETATGFTTTTPYPTDTLFLVNYIVTGAINNVGTNSSIFGETPAGLVNSSNALYTLGRSYIPGSLSVYINGWKQKGGGVHFTETNPALGTFTMSDAPVTGDDIMTDSQFNLNPSSNSDTVDGLNASTTPTANTLYPLGSDSKFNVKVLPGTILATATRNTTLPYTGSEQQILSIVVTVTQDMIDSGRKLKLTFFAPQLYSNDASSRARVTIFEGSTVLTRTYQPMQGGAVLANAVNIATPAMAMPSLGNHTYVASFSRDVGSGTSTLYAGTGADMWLEAEVK